MGEGLLSGAFESEEEPKESSTEAGATNPSAEAFAATIAANLARVDEGETRKAEGVLGKQSRLLDIQAHHLEREYSARLHLLQGQAREKDKPVAMEMRR
jgi:hypothetical protein